MAKFFKVKGDGFYTYNCINENKRLMVIPETTEKFGSESSLGEEQFYKEIYKDLLEEEISEREFIEAVGDIQGNIKNFMDRLNIE